MGSPLFTNHNPSCLHTPIGEGIWMEAVEMHKFQRSEWKFAPSPSLLEVPSTAKNTKKKKWALNKLAPTATSTADPPPIYFPLDNILLADLPVPLPSRALTVKDSRDMSEGAIFTRFIKPIEEQLVGLE